MSYFLLPILIPAFAALLLPVFSLLKTHRRQTAVIAFFALALTLLAVIYLQLPDPPWAIPDMILPGGADPTQFLAADAFSAFMSVLFILVAMMVVIAAVDQLKDLRFTAEFHALVLLATAGMITVVMARELITLFIGLELAGVASFALAAYRRENRATMEGALKFFFVGATSAALTLFGISLIYALYGTTVLSELADPLVVDVTAFSAIPLLAGGLIVAGLAFKVTAWPFHSWAPDTYQAAPHPVSALLSSASKKMGFAALFKIFLVGLVLFRFDFQLLFGVLALATMFYGNIVALRQKEVKRMLAYSSIGHAGYILAVLAVPTPEMVAAGLLHMLVHGFMNTGMFLAAGALEDAGVGTKIDDYRGLRKRAPGLTAMMFLLLLSLAGIPILAGFWTKLFLAMYPIREAALNPDYSMAVLLSVGIFVSSAISLFYYLRLVRNIMVDDPERKAKPVSIPMWVLIPIFAATAAVVMIGLFPDPFWNFALDAANALLGP